MNIIPIHREQFLSKLKSCKIKSFDFDISFQDSSPDRVGFVRILSRAFDSNFKLTEERTFLLSTEFKKVENKKRQPDPLSNLHPNSRDFGSD
ncbi:hypothetical protein DPV73_09335 [Leptospira mayottensis]|nr:hypothetical protein DPV73_09335 [Leptospira mayottensis]